MAKKFSLNKGFRDRGAVNVDKAGFAARALFVNGTRD
jgi:hypothetical protein